jgi:dTMP kinase
LSLFIVFEGGEGCGKSTQAKALYRRLSRAGIPAVLTHEPGGTSLSLQVRRWLKEGRKEAVSPLTELLLFAASRAQLVTEVIRPSLEKGKVVVCDRYVDSTTAYQGYGRGVEMEVIHQIGNIATQGIYPDLVILLDIPVEAGLSRKKTIKDRFEQEELSFHQRVRQGYLQMAAEEPERWLVVDAALPKEKVAEIVWEKVSPLVGRR